MINIRGIPKYPFTVVGIPRNEAIVTKLVATLKKITGSKGCPGLSDANFINSYVNSRDNNFPDITIDAACDMFRSHTRSFPTVPYEVILMGTNDLPRRELTT